MQRAILHMDLDSFFVSVERLLDSRLRGKPILLGGTSDRGVVASCSYEAREYGVRSGMAMKMAKQRCPEGIVIRGNSMTYTKYSRIITEILKEEVPLLEKASIDEFYADLSGMDQFFGCYAYASELRRKIIHETGLPISFGLSENKTVSKIATGEAKPNNQLRVDEGREKDFLAPLHVGKIPMVGEKTLHQLAHMGVRRIGVLQQIPIEMMQATFGQAGNTIWKKAQGIDNRPVIPYTERKSISTERTFDRDTTDVQKLQSLLTAMAENLAFQLRRGHKLTACISVRIRYSDFQTYSKQRRIPYCADDDVLIRYALDLFYSLYNRRLLVRLIGIRFSDLVHGRPQIQLFEDSQEKNQLFEAMDTIREKHGQRSVVRACGLEAKTIGRHNPFSGEPPVILAHRKQ